MNSTQHSSSACSVISNTNRACYELSNETSARWASLGIIRLSKIILQEAILCLSGEGCFASDGNDIHCSRCHRTVSFKDAKNYLVSFDSNRYVFHNDSCEVKNGIHNTKTSSIKKQLYGLVTGYFITMFAHLIEDPWEGFDCNPSFMDIFSVLTDIYYPPASDLVSVIQVGIAFYALANIPCCEAGAIENVIEIDDFDMFQKIGRDKDYPSDGHYILTKDLVGNNNIHPVIEDFSGSLDGQGYSILQHSGCLIRNFKGYGIIGNIIFKYSNGIDASCSPLVAMFARDHSLLKNVRVENYKLCSKQDHIHVAIMIGNLINWARIEHCSVVDASVVFQGEGANFAFFVLSMHDDSSVYNSAIINSSVNLDTKTLSFCGSIVHMFERSRCSNITMINCTMTLSADKFAYGTFGGVWLYNNAQVNNVLAIRCNIEITGTGLTKAGIGAASLWGADTLSNFNMAIDSNLKIDGDGGSTGIGAAESVGAQSHNNVAIGCHIEVEGVKSSAAVGIGYEHKKDTKSHNNIAIKTRIEAFNRDSTVAISVGNSFECSNLYNTIIDSTLATLERVSTMVFSGSYNRAIICRDLLYYRIGLLNKNCTLNQQGFDAYVNRIANWNTTVLNTGRVVRLPEPVNVTMIKEDVTSIENTVIPDRAVSPNMEIEQKNSGVIAVALASGLMVSFFMVSYYRGYKKGSRGRALLMYPLTMCKNCIKGTTRPERAVNMDVFYSEVSSTHNSDNALDPSLDGRGSDSPPAYSDLEIMHSASASASANLPSYSEVMQNSVE